MRHHLKSTVALSALMLAVAAGAAQAQTRGSATAPDVAGTAAANAVEGVVVVANRTPQPLAKVGQSVTVLTLPEIQADQELVISDIIVRTPGVGFSRNGGPGSATGLRIRGAESDQTQVLIDGVKLNDPSAPGGGYNFGDLLVSDVARIEILRGPQSTLYGSQAIGGVVNIVTVDPSRPLQGDAQVEGGSFGTGYAKAGIGGREGKLTWRLAANAYTSTGISAFSERRGGKEPDGYRNQGVTGRLGYAFTPDVSLDLRGVYVQARNKFDGFSTPTFSFGDDAEYGATRETIGYAGLNAAALDGRLKNRVAVQYTLTQRDSYDPADAPATKVFDGRGINARAEYQGTFAIAPGYAAVFGAEHERSSLTTSSPAFDFPPGLAPTKAHVSINSGYGQLQGEVLPGLNLTGGLRYDDHETFGGHTTGQAAAAWSLFEGATTLRFSYGQGFKAPTLYQLYSIYGSIGLNPEEADGWDAGVEQRFWGGRATVQATYFARDTTNLITFVSCPFRGPLTGRCVTQSNGYYANVARSEADGVELSGAVRPIGTLEVTANYTYTHAQDRSPGAATFGRELARRPQEMANVAASYTFPFALKTGVAVRYAGRSFENAANTTRLKSYTLVDLRASYPLPHGLEVYARVENLFDKPYETAFRYGTPGRAGYAGVRATF